MRWLQVLLGALTLLSTTGCPSEFGRQGRVARAIHKDSIERVHKACSEDEREAACGPGQEHSKACLECGE